MARMEQLVGFIGLASRSFSTTALLECVALLEQYSHCEEQFCGVRNKKTQDFKLKKKKKKGMHIQMQRINNSIPRILYGLKVQLLHKLSYRDGHCEQVCRNQSFCW